MATDTLPIQVRVAIAADSDIVAARQKGRELASRLGFSGGDLAVIATAISELARNIVRYAGRGDIELSLVTQGPRRGIVVVAHDEGPGITDVSLAMQDGYSTARSLGMGLPGVKRLMDEFDIQSRPGKGTTVTAKKWRL